MSVNANRCVCVFLLSICMPCLYFHTLETICDALVFCPIYFLFGVLEPSFLGDNQNHLLRRLCLVMFYSRIHFGQPPNMKGVSVSQHTCLISIQLLSLLLHIMEPHHLSFIPVVSFSTWLWNLFYSYIDMHVSSKYQQTWRLHNQLSPSQT